MHCHNNQLPLESAVDITGSAVDVTCPLRSVSRSGCATGKKTRTGPDCNWLQLDQWSGFFIFLIKQPQATGLFHRLLTGCNRFITANRFSIKIPTKLAQSLENWMKIE
jgi:hypothetical protein